MKILFESPKDELAIESVGEPPVAKLPVIDNPAPSQDEPPVKADNTKLNVIIIAVVIILVIAILVYYFKQSKEITQ